jgi:protein subunit release factor A
MRAEEEDRYYEEYVDWVNNRINQTQLNIEDEDFRIDSFIPGIHAGGQGMQTSRSGKRAVHLITNISAEMGKGGRSGAAKEMEAKKIALERLQSHLESWKTYLNGKDGELRDITPQDLFEVVVD